MRSCRWSERILRAVGEIQRSLFFSTAIMVCAFLPLFTMAGPEGQIFGPMADTYAFALGGALLLALTLSPVLCCVAPASHEADPGQLARPLVPGVLPAATRAGACGIRWLTLGGVRGRGGGHRGPVAVAGRRVHAGAGRGEHLGPAVRSR